jgi:hypothetical protein
MKKVLLLMSAMLLATSGAFAQKLVPAKSLDKAVKHEVKAMAADNSKFTMAPAIMAPAFMEQLREVKATPTRNRAPKKVYDDGVWYQRPVGSFYVSGSNSPNYWSYIYLPAFTDAIWTNKATDKDAATWAYVWEGEIDQELEGNENNDLEARVAKVANGYISSYWIPQMTVGKKNYVFGENFPNQPQVALINGDSIEMVTNVNLSNGYYYGFSNGGTFGNRTATFDMNGKEVNAVSDALYEFYNKPIKPICLNDIFFRVVNYEGTPLMNEDTEMKIIIRKVEDDVIGDVIAEMPFTLEDATYIEEDDGKTFGAFLVSKKEEDAFGTQFDVPIIIEDEFVLILSGFDQPDVNFTVYMSGDNKNVETDSFLKGGMVTPTCRSYVRADNGEPIEGLYYCQAITKEQSDQYNVEDGDDTDWTRHYNAVFHLDLMTDVVSVYEGFETMYALPEGGNIFAIVEEENEETGNTELVAYGSLQYETTLPRLSTWEGLEGEDNYEFVDLPDWLTVKEFNDEYYEEYDVTLAVLEAAPLPEGMDSRTATFRIVSERGADSGIITVVQQSLDEPEVLDLTINHERQTGLGYTADQVAVDLTEAAAYLGVDAITTDMLRIENPDGTLISDYAPFDGWFDGDGVATAWGDNTKICVKFFQALEGGQFDVCDMNGADEDGKTYTVKWQLVNGEKAVRYTINVTFKKPEVKELEIVDKGIATSVTYDVTEGDYVMKTATITDEQVAAICQELGIEALTDATIFGFNPTTQELVQNYTGYDGWRDANGDFHNWNADGTQAPACVKINDNGTTDGGQTYYCYNRSGQEAQTIKCYWALANEEKAVLVEIDFVYFAVIPDAPELTAPEGWTSVISNGNLAGDDVKNYIAKEYPSTEPTGATIVPGAGKDGSRGIVVKSQDKVSEAWDSQFWIQFGEKLPDGTKLHVEFDYKADLAGSVSTQSHGLPGAYQHWAAIGNVDFDTEWKHFSADVDVAGDMVTGGGGDGMLSIAFNLNDIANANNYYFDNFGVWIQKPAPVDDWTNILRNSDLEGTQVDNFFSKEAPSTAVVPSTIFDGAGIDGSRGIKVVSAPAAANDWDTQFWIYLPTTLPEGTKYKVEFDYKADRNASADTQAHGEPGNYIFYTMIGSPSFTTEWQHYVKEGTISADQAEGKTDGVPNGNKMRSIAFNLSKDKDNEVTYFFDNIMFFVEKAFAETGIVNVNSNNVVEGAIYNLRGQQVKNAQKGIFIQNGKKIVVK